jgi:stearoyl-CoA desaturase (delta-9 desaturase)
MAQAATATREPPVRGVTPMDSDQIKWQRRAVLALTILPLVGFLTATITLWGTGFSGSDGLILLVTYVVTGLGITVGFHRLLTHRSFKAPRWVRYAFAIAGSMAMEGPVIGWVADHRRHHAYSDKEGDPHSPHLDAGEGMFGVLKGLWHAHTGWMFKKVATERARWAPDMLKDRGMVRIDRAFPALAVLTLAMPAVIGLMLTQSWSGALTAFLWGGLTRIFLLHHVTWSINSVCHFYGRRPFETTDYSTNNWPLALVSFGESWHNNHHAFPSSAIHGLGRWQIDPGGMLIRGLEKVRLAWDVKIPDEKRRESI